MLDIGTSGYTDSRIRCNAEVSGCTGYAELRAATSYDMILNQSKTRADGGWMYFKINNDDYMQLPSSDNKVHIYKNTSSGKLEIINNTQSWEVLSLESTIAGYCCFHNYKTAQSTTAWNTGIWNESEYGIRHGSNGMWIYDTGNTTSGNLNVGSTGNNSIKIHGTGATTSYAKFKVSNNQNCVWDFQNPSNNNAWSTIRVKGVKLMDFSPNGNIIIHYKPFANSSDDRLKENEELIEHACETLYKLKPIIRQEAKYGK